MHQMVAGVAKANITPPVGMLMSGYGNRKSPAQDVHDELKATVLYVSDGHTEIGLVTADLLDCDAAGTARIRSAAEALSGVPSAHIMVAMSHTHGGPQTTLRASARPDALMEAYTTVAVAQMAGALARAKRNAAPVRIGYGRQDCDIGGNRRERTASGVILGINHQGPTQPYTDVIRVDSLVTSQPMAVLFSYAAHGTTLGETNLLYTADYIGFARNAVERQMPTARALFVAGCSGDINPYPRGEFSHARSHGMRLGCAAAQATWEVGDMVESRPLAIASLTVPLYVERPPCLAEARAALAAQEERAAREVEAARRTIAGAPVDESMALDWWSYRRLKNARDLVAALDAGETEFAIPIEIQAMAIGESALVGIPGEIFVEIGLAIAEASPFEHTIVISHANGSVGYIPTAKEVPAGGYEIERARGNVYGLPIVPEADELVRQAAIEALRLCWEQARR